MTAPDVNALPEADGQDSLRTDVARVTGERDAAVASDRCRWVIRAARERLRQCEMVDPPYPRWINADDPAESWCESCGTKRVLELRASQPDTEPELDGGYAAHMSDYTAACNGCGRMLAYTLSDHGMLEEVDHFTKNPPKELSPSTAYEVWAALDGVEYSADVDLLKNAAALARKAAGLARAVVAATEPEGEHG